MAAIMREASTGASGEQMEVHIQDGDHSPL